MGRRKYEYQTVTEYRSRLVPVLNELGLHGWRVISVLESENDKRKFTAVLERWVGRGNVSGPPV